VILAAGPYRYKEVNIAFHFIRENVYSPWRSIGVFVVWRNWARASYIRPYRHLKKEFDLEVEQAGPSAFTYEFLDRWHKRHQNSVDVVSKVIRYCTTNDMDNVFKKVARRYCGSLTPSKLGMMTIMLRSEPRYFPIQYSIGSSDRPRQVAELRKAGLIN
tara:strand:- start:416 stop:892 length:477 start_codon:yes stop_codon:yes gene_type:complete